MPFTVEETGPLTRTANVSVPAEDFRRDFNKALKNLSKRVRIPGFRKGKIPLSVMRRNYGAQVLPDVIDNLVRQHVDQVLDQAERVIYLGQAELQSAPQDDTGFDFSLEFEVRPDLDPIGYIGVDVERPSTEVSSEEIDQRLEELRYDHSSLDPIEFRTTVAKGDVVDVDIKPIGEHSEEDALANADVAVDVGSGMALPGLEEALEGAEFGSTITTTIQLDANFPLEHLREQDVELELKIKSVKKRTLPEIDDEFAADTGLGETLIEVRSAIREQLQAQKEHSAMHIAEDSLLQALLKDNEVELPPKFVEEQTKAALQNQIQSMAQRGMPLDNLNIEEFMASVKDQRISQLRTEFLLLAVAEKESFKVDEEDLNAYFEHQAQHMGVSARELERYMKSDQDRFNQAATSALLEKTLRFLLGEATITEVPWPEDDEDSAEAAASEEE